MDDSMRGGHPVAPLLLESGRSKFAAVRTAPFRRSIHSARTSMQPPEFFADPRLIVDDHGHDEGRIRLSVLNGTGLALSTIVVSAELRYRADDEEPFALLGPVTVESWEPPYFAAGVQTFEFDLGYPEELAAIIDDVVITYIVVASEFQGVEDDDLLGSDVEVDDPDGVG
jgi:hypothetical protein